MTEYCASAAPAARAAYATLAKERAALRSLFGADRSGYLKAYAKRKQEIVGEAALKAKGCAPARIE